VCESRERHLFWSADGKKKADGKTKAKRKPLSRKSPCHEGAGQSEKGSEEGAAPASIAKDSEKVPCLFTRVKVPPAMMVNKKF
jgi:hypothetical protein